jgi:hypothetical protein
MTRSIPPDLISLPRLIFRRKIVIAIIIDFEYSSPLPIHSSHPAWLVHTLGVAYSIEKG